MTIRAEGIGVLVLLKRLILGGMEVNAVDFAWAVRRLGVACVLVGERDPEHPESPILEVAAGRGVPVELVDRAPTTMGRARVMSELVRRHRCDLVHTYGWWSARPSFWGPGRFGRLPLVMTAYEMSLQPHIYPGVDLIVGTRYQLEGLAAQRRGAVHFISPPVDLGRDNPAVVPTEAFATKLALPRNHVRIVVVSRLDKEMKALGVEHAMHAVEHLASSSLDLVVVGTGDAETQLRAIGEGINHRLGRRAIVFAGPMADPRPAYACAHVVLGMGGSAARGIAFGKPLVVLGEYGWSGTFTPRSAPAIFRNSFWSDERPDDPVGLLVDELRPLVCDAARRRELAAFGRPFATEHFGLEAMAERLTAVYEEAVRRPARRRTWIIDAQRDLRPANLAGYMGRRLRRQRFAEVRT